MKNPFMSMWLSAANSWASSARGLYAAQHQRQQTQMLQEMTEQWVRWWSGAWMLPQEKPARSRQPQRR